MKYELWSIILNKGKRMPLLKLFENDDFKVIWEKFMHFMAIDEPVILMAIKDPIPEKYKTDEKIYESPDGNTIYERTMLQNKRKKIR